MVVALVRAMPHAWYPDDKQANVKRRLLEELISHAAIPAGKLPDEFAVKATRYLTTRRWLAPSGPSRPQDDKPMNPLVWILPSVIGGGALVALGLALFGNWMLETWRSWQVVVDLKPQDEPPVTVGERLPPVPIPELASPEGKLWPEIAESLTLSPGSSDPFGPKTVPDSNVPGQTPRPDEPFNGSSSQSRMPPSGFDPFTSRPAVPRPARPRLLRSVPLEFAAPFAFGADMLATAVPEDLTADASSPAAAIPLLHLPRGDCSIRLHGHEGLNDAARSGDFLAASSLGSFQSVEVDEGGESVAVLARFQNQAQPIRLARFAVEQGILKYEADDPSSPAPADPQVARLRKALRHCVLEIQVAGQDSTAFVALAKPPAYRFQLDAEGSRVIHDPGQNTLSLPGDADGENLYLGNGRIVYGGYRSLEFGSSWRQESPTKEWTVAVDYDLAGLEGLKVSLQATDGRVTLAVRPPAAANEEEKPAAQPDPDAAKDRKRDIEARLAKAEPSIRNWVQLLAASGYSDAKLRGSRMAAEALAKELGLPPPPNVPKMSSNTVTGIVRYSLRNSSQRGHVPAGANKTFQEVVEKMNEYVAWGNNVLLPEARLELMNLNREILGTPSPSALSAAMAQQRYQLWLRSSVAVEVNIYRLMPCEGPGGVRNLRVLVVAPGRDMPPPVHALLNSRPVDVGYVWPLPGPRI